MRTFLLGLVVGFLLVGCFSASFVWQYYSLDIASYDGKLLAVQPANNKNFSICAPDQNVKGKCILMEASDFYALKADYMDVQTKLNACQNPNK